MRALRGSTKGQGLIEYGIILVLILLVVVAANAIFRPWISQLASGSIPTAPNSPHTSAWLVDLLDRTWFATTTVGITILLSMGINRLVSIQDGTERYSHKLNAKYCLSGISFDLWGLTTVLQSNGQIPSNSHFITGTVLGISMLGLIFMHMIFHKKCLDTAKSRWTPEEKAIYQFLLVLTTIAAPFFFAFFCFYIPPT